MQALKADLEKAHSTELDGVRKSATESRPNLAMSLDSLDIQVHEKIKGYSTNLKKNIIFLSGSTPQVMILQGNILILILILIINISIFVPRVCFLIYRLRPYKTLKQQKRMVVYSQMAVKMLKGCTE